MTHTILKTMKGSLCGSPCDINQCYQPSYNAGEKVGQDIFYTIGNSIHMPANAFWNAVNNGSIKIKGGKS